MDFLFGLQDIKSNEVWHYERLTMYLKKGVETYFSTIVVILKIYMLVHVRP